MVGVQLAVSIVFLPFSAFFFCLVLFLPLPPPRLSEAS
jgi:hypothetical protein